VSKYDLLQMMNKHFGLNLTIHRYEDFYCDRSLAAMPFQQLGIPVPTMEDMVAEMAAENAAYQRPMSMMVQIS